MQQGRLSDDGRSRGGRRHENGSQEVGSTRTGEKKEVSIIKKNKDLPRSYVEVGVKKLLRAGTVPAKPWEHMQRG